MFILPAWSRLFAAVLLIAGLCEFASAAPLACDVSKAKVSEDIRKWQREVIGQFSTVRYLDADGKPMAGECFLQVISEKKAGFVKKVTVTDGEPVSIELALLH